ncbi:MAG: hypothetical protein KAS69_03625 [Planctomycetes bacterium]|nr:hypothetical protein [Planctomycetota bacterium]
MKKSQPDTLWNAACLKEFCGCQTAKKHYSLQLNNLSFYFCTFVLLFSISLQTGCIVGIMGTSRESEKSIPAEYNLIEKLSPKTPKNKKNPEPAGKILILVEQPEELNAQTNLRFYLTEAINATFVLRADIFPECLISYEQIADFRSNTNDFSLLQPQQIAKALAADVVLLVAIEDYKLSKLPQEEFYKGFLSTKAVLLDAANGEQLWPKLEKGRIIKVGFEFEQNGKERTIERLATSSAHCITRYLYDCPKPRFKIFDDRTGAAWQSWGE